jgi:hypothetical protein
MIMQEHFDLTVQYNGKEFHFDTLFMPVGYTHKFKVLVEGMEVFFEPDEEGHYRAVLPAGMDEKMKRNIDMPLLQEIANTIKKALE